MIGAVSRHTVAPRVAAYYFRPAYSGAGHYEVAIYRRSAAAPRFLLLALLPKSFWSATL